MAKQIAKKEFFKWWRRAACIYDDYVCPDNPKNTSVKSHVNNPVRLL